MMKSHSLLRGSGAGVAAIIQVDTTVSFLLDRQEVINLSPMPASNAGYVWKRVFLRGNGHRA